MRIAFLGTPEFAIPSLEMLIGEGHELCVFTQPDRPKDRGHGIAMPPVKALALEHGIPVFQFNRIREPEGVEALRSFAPDLMVTAAFGQILSAENLLIPKYGCINVHGSLLPKYRGAAPIQWSIVNGERVTGVTTMMTEIGLDSGDILLSCRTEIGEDETAGELYSRLAVMGADLLKRTIEKLEEGTLERTPQDPEEATFCGMIKKQMAAIDFTMPAARIHDLVRGMNPSPVAFTTLDGCNLKVYRTAKACPYEIDISDAVPGQCVIADGKRGLFVRCGDGVIELCEIQFAGSKRMQARAAMNSKNLLGRVLGQ